MNALSKEPEAYSFRQTVVAPLQRELTHAGKRVDVSARAFDLLLLLIAAQGMPVSRETIKTAVWPDRVVEENTIEGQISTLRKAFGSDREAIRTIAGRGYQFVAELVPIWPVEPDSARPGGVLAVTRRRPESLAGSPLFGRDHIIPDLVQITRTRRLVTLLGTGGVGKTRLAFEVAHALADDYPDGVFYAELAATVSAEFVPTTVAIALGYPPDEESLTLDSLGQKVVDKRFLLVIDNCEHLIDSVARITERLLLLAPRITILTTSRETLRLNGEYIYRVPSLDVPEGDDNTNSRSFGAIQLFDYLVRSRTSYRLRESDFPLVGQICRRLDGIPLAIELAAACVSALGVEGIADQLDDRFQVLTQGSRTALPRQQTLLATLAWSYNLLDEPQKVVLERLSLLAGQFTLEAAKRIASDEALSAADVVDAIIALEQKSLISSIHGARRVGYRLLETTRAYARDMLRERGDDRERALRHASYFLEVFREAERLATARAEIDWFVAYAHHLDDLRSAISWGFGGHGDVDVAINLTVASLPLSLHFSLLNECLVRVDMALRCLSEVGDVHDERAMKLYAARGTCLLSQMADESTGEAFDRSRVLAEELDNVDYQLRGIWGRWDYTYRAGRFDEARLLADRYASLAARSDIVSDRVVAQRLSAMSHLLKADIEGACVQLAQAEEKMLAIPRAQRIRFLYDERVLVRTTHAHLLWYTGRPEAAIAEATQAFKDAEELDHPASLCYSLSAAVCVLALLTGDRWTLRHATAALAKAVNRHGESTWRARSKMWEAYIELEDGNDGVFDRVIVPGFTDIGTKRFLVSLTPFFTETALLIGGRGRSADGIRLIEPVLNRALNIKDECSAAELLRAKAELVLLRDGIDIGWHEAEVLLLKALERSRKNGFLAWELRAGMSLERLYAATGTGKESVSTLETTLARFTEGFDTADLRQARALLDARDAGSNS